MCGLVYQTIFIIFIRTVYSDLTNSNEINNNVIPILPDNLFFQMCLLSRSLANTFHMSTFLYKISDDTLPSHFFVILNIMIGPIVLTNTVDLVNNDCILIITQSVITLNELLIDSEFDWNYRRYYVVILTEKSENVETIFEILWMKYKVINVLMSYFKNLDNIIIYKPFSSQNKIKIMSVDQLYEMKNLIKYRMKNMNGNLLKITMFQKRLTAILDQDGKYHGIDPDILNIVAKAMNFVPILQAPADGERYGYQQENGKFTGALGDILNNRSVFVANGMFIKDYKSSDLEFTTPILFDQLCLAVPKSEQIPQWKKMFLCFSHQVWCGILATYITALLFWCAIHKIQREKKFDCSLTVIQFFSIFLALPCHMKLCGTSERLFIMSSITFGIVMANCFQGSLVNILSNNAYKKEITTMEEFDLSGLRIFTTSQNLHDTFATDDNNPTLDSLVKKFTIYNKSDDILMNVASERFGAAIGRRVDLNFKIAYSYMRENNPLIHIVEECPRSYYISYVILKKSPYLNTINYVLSCVFESGILESSFMGNGIDFKFKNKNNWKEQIVFELDHLWLAFIFLLSGIWLSTFVFFVEIITARYLKKSKLKDQNEFTGPEFLN